MSIGVRHERGNEYVVTVENGRGSTSYTVTVWPSDVARYAPESTPEELLHAAFEFLLEREPPHAILSRFELPVIERYFPDFPEAMATRFA
jgi:hypothetical protein